MAPAKIKYCVCIGSPLFGGLSALVALLCLVLAPGGGRHAVWLILDLNSRLWPWLSQE
jgi:hypothetical protein